MRSRILPMLIFAAACSSGGGGGNGVGATGFPGVWQYQVGSFSFVNCYVSSRTVELDHSGFRIVEEAGKLVRIDPDGCRFTVVQSTASHAEGVTGEDCTVQGKDAVGNPLTTHYRLKSLVMELRPDDASQMIEVFDLDAEQSSSLGSYDCEISGNNTLDRAP